MTAKIVLGSCSDCNAVAALISAWGSAAGPWRRLRIVFARPTAGEGVTAAAVV